MALDLQAGSDEKCRITDSLNSENMCNHSVEHDILNRKLIRNDGRFMNSLQSA